MYLYENKMWNDDVSEVIKLNQWIKEYEGKSVLITGATGGVCSAIVDILIKNNEVVNNPTEIYVAGRSFEKMKNRFGKYTKENFFHFVEFDATDGKLNIDKNIDFMIHGASNSSPDMLEKEPVETLLENVIGMYGILKYGKKHEVVRILYVSSSEIYGKLDYDGCRKEDQYGKTDLLIPRNAYAIGKQAGENMCVSFSKEYQIDTVIVRPGHIYGPTMSANDKHVSSQWAYNASQGSDIIMKSSGSQVRSYCHCLDCASAILAVLLKGERCKAYNVSNPNSVISIKQLAQILSEYSNVELKVETPSYKEVQRFNPMSNSSLDSTKLLKLGWNCIFDAKNGLEHTVNILREIKSELS